MRIRKPLLALAALVAVAPLSQVCAAGVDAASLPRDLRISLAWQIALERAGFSPGLVDGKPGAKTTLATTEFQRSRGLPVTGKLDTTTAAALLNPPVSLLTTRTLTEADAKLVTPNPTDWNRKAKMPFLGYPSLAEVVCERHHTTRAFLAQLNPDLDLTRLKPGDVLTVPAVVEPEGLPRAARLEINLLEKAIRVFDRSDRLVALFHCSIAADVSKRPTGTGRVVVVTPNPAYTFDPKMWPEVNNVKRKLLIPPGPRNPVGLCWVGLNLPGYGIHGTPNPEMIGKTGSHGCFRLTNWDAVRLGRLTAPGTPVAFLSSTVAETPTRRPAAAPPSPPTLPSPEPRTALADADAGNVAVPTAAQPLKEVPWEQLLMGAMAATTQPSAPPPAVVDDSLRGR